MIKITLVETLDRHKITANKLSVESKVRPSTIYDIINNQATTVTFVTMVKLVETLRELTGDKSINVMDIFRYEDD